MKPVQVFEGDGVDPTVLKHYIVRWQSGRLATEARAMKGEKGLPYLLAIHNQPKAEARWTADINDAIRFPSADWARRYCRQAWPTELPEELRFEMAPEDDRDRVAIIFDAHSIIKRIHKYVNKPGNEIQLIVTCNDQHDADRILTQCNRTHDRHLPCVVTATSQKRSTRSIIVKGFITGTDDSSPMKGRPEISIRIQEDL